MIETYRRIKRQRAAEEFDGGFTLIELLIVIVVLGILAAVVVFSLGTITGKSAVAACEADAQQLNTGLAAYYAANQAYPTTAQSLTILAPNYLQTIPNNPTHYVFTYSGTASTSFLTVTSPDGTVKAVVSATDGTGVGAVAACTTSKLVQ